MLDSLSSPSGKCSKSTFFFSTLSKEISSLESLEVELEAMICSLITLLSRDISELESLIVELESMRDNGDRRRLVLLKRCSARFFKATSVAGGG